MPVNKQDPSWTDTFKVEVKGDTLFVWRTDIPGGGWGQKLVLSASRPQALQDELLELHWSVTRTWDDFAWLHTLLTDAKRKPPRLPVSGIGTFIQESLGSVAAAARDGEFLTRELPRWLNIVITTESTRDDP